MASSQPPPHQQQQQQPKQRFKQPPRASVVDISEIDDNDDDNNNVNHNHNRSHNIGLEHDTDPAGHALAVGAPRLQAAQHEQQQRQQHQLYLFHETDSQPTQRPLSSLLLSVGQTRKSDEPAPQSVSASATPVPQSWSGGVGGGGGDARAHSANALATLNYTTSQSAANASAARHDTSDRGGARATSAQSASGPPDESASEQAASSKANLGTLTGVYFPCVQNIFGVILFIRMVWIVGTAGVPAAFALVFICCCVTLATSISLSAIATNGIVPAGGSYFMISRSLGPECGGAVGTLFFLGTTVAGAMYITGAVEIMLNYLAPSWGLFGDFQRDVSIMYHNIRIYGTLLLMLVGLFVWIGVRFVSKLAPVALFCVLFSIFSIYAGIFINYQGRSDLMLCVVGDRLVTLNNMPSDLDQIIATDQAAAAAAVAMANATGGAESDARRELARLRALCTFERLKYVFCPSSSSSSSSSANGDDNDDNHNGNNQKAPSGAMGAQSTDNQWDVFKRAPNMSNCDPYFKHNRHRIHLERAVPGLASGVLFQNMAPRFRPKGAHVAYDSAATERATGARAANRPSGELGDDDDKDDKGDDDDNGANGFNYVFVDITTSFTALIAIYFPSCTGILAGSNRSGDLADAQRSIPRGTIGAQLTTSFVYLSCIVLFGATFNNLFIRDKFGESMGGQLAVTQIAWPQPEIILIGGLLSTLGAALQSLVGAPRILQGIAKDEVIPCFRRFARLSARGEPEAAIFATLAIAELAVLIGNLDFIAPILTLSLVMCYFFINLACTLHSLLGSPGWRPRFKHYHWSVSTLGCLLCLFVMIVSSWVYFLVAIFLASCIYKYIEFSGAEKEWGDGKQGLALSAATYNLLRLRTGAQHTKNWRPQLLLFVKLKRAAELEPPLVKAQQAAAAAAAAARRANKPEARTATATGADDLVGELGAGAGADELAVAEPRLLTFASQLKAGKGLTMVSAVVEGDFKSDAGVANRARNTLQAAVQRERVRGFADVLVARSVMDGLAYQVQAAGLGGLKHNTVIVGWPIHWRRPLHGHSVRSHAATHSHSHSHSHSQSQTQPHALAGSGSGGGGGASATAAGTPQRRTRAHRFIEVMRHVQASENALLVVKGAQQWPESCDKLGGSIDIWWIVNDGGLLMLLPHLLKQHRTWRACTLRVFTVAQLGDDAAQMRNDLETFLYNLRIEAKVDIVEMDTEVSEYAYERTLMMEQRGEIFRRLGAAAAATRKQSLLLEQEVDGRVIRFRIRKQSTCDFEDLDSASSLVAGHLTSGGGGGGGQIPMIEMHGQGSGLGSACASALQSPVSHSHTPTGLPPPPPTTTTTTTTTMGGSGEAPPPPPQPPLAGVRPDETNVRRMQTALSLNEAILRRSKAAKLVILNLPGAPKVSTPEAENNYMEFVEVITDKLERVLLVQNGGREVITIHS